MASVYRKKRTKPLPENAKVSKTRKGGLVARWTDGRGTKHEAPVRVAKDGTRRIKVVSAVYTAKYRDGLDRLVERSTGCRDKDAAGAKLTQWLAEAEKVRSGLLSPDELNAAEHQHNPLAEHIDGYIGHLAHKGTTEGHRKITRRYIEKVSAECCFTRLSDLSRQRLERWLGDQTRAGRSARSRNAHQTAMVSFANWCLQTNRLTRNPFQRIAKANVKTDRRRQRRSFTEEEFKRFLKAAAQRPLREARTIRRGKRKGQLDAKVTPERQAKLEFIGRERALVYKALATTGLRRNELASLKVNQLVLDGDVPHAILQAADEKNRQGSTVPINEELARDLREHLAAKLDLLRAAQRAKGAPVPVRLRPDEPALTVPRHLITHFDKDLAAAGIPKVDDRGRTLDVHALRTSFGTWMSAHGVAPRTAQKAMRHSDINLTMQTYTDPELIDTKAAVEKLPSFPLDWDDSAQTQKKTGTDDEPPTSRQPRKHNRTCTPLSAPESAPVAGKSCYFTSEADNSEGMGNSGKGKRTVVVSVRADKSKAPLSTGDKGAGGWLTCLDSNQEYLIQSQA